MQKGDLTDLNESPPPAGSTLVTITAAAFIIWMKACGYKKGDENPNQEVFFIQRLPNIKIREEKEYTPNWHITAMLVHRQGGNCRNFHFKVEMGKAAAHYWHYVIHEHNGNFVWVGDPNPLCLTTNEGGGGAGASNVLIRKNRADTQAAARVHQLDGLVNRNTQLQMMRVLKRLITKDQLGYDTLLISV